MMQAKAAANGGNRARSADDRLYQLAGQITERDRLVCRLLYEHRVLTTRQIADVGFGSLRKAQQRLALLHGLEVVDRFRLRSWSVPVRTTSPSTPPVLRLSPLSGV
jgi:hypothetical protein